jgi:uncharacterized protein (DUF1330 family)
MAETSNWTGDPEIDEALRGRDLSQPVAMLNLLKFQRRARYASDSGETPCSGVEAYARYAKLVKPVLEPLGATVILTGVAWLIGRPDEWDRSFIVRYNHATDILNLSADPAYRKVAHHRTAALADSRLLMLTFDATGLG